MFTGIIQAIGQIAHIEPRGGDVRLHIDAGSLDLSDVAKSWVITSYVLAFGGLLLLGGRIGDAPGESISLS